MPNDLKATVTELAAKGVEGLVGDVEVTRTSQYEFLVRVKDNSATMPRSMPRYFVVKVSESLWFSFS